MGISCRKSCVAFDLEFFIGEVLFGRVDVTAIKGTAREELGLPINWRMSNYLIMSIDPPYGWSQATMMMCFDPSSCIPRT